MMSGRVIEKRRKHFGHGSNHVSRDQPSSDHSSCKTAKRPKLEPLSHQKCDDEKMQPALRLCQYCQRSEPKEGETIGALPAKEVFGHFGVKGQCRAHYCCVFFARCLKQQDQPKMEELFGFRPADVTRNLQKYRTTLCIFCKKPYAALKCEICDTYFHFPCAFENDVMLDYKNFTSFCSNHHRQQHTGDGSASVSKGSNRCVICQEDVATSPAFSQLQAPCCKWWFHRKCLQAYAFSAASHHLKCPLCNDIELFKEELIAFGLHVPMRDAAWERDPDAFRSMYETEFRCSAFSCICPSGRTVVGGPKSKYGQLTCSMCGFNSVHRSCTATAALGSSWICHDCSIGPESESVDDDDNTFVEEQDYF